MKTESVGGVLAGLLLAAAVSLGAILTHGETAAQAPVTMGVDADPTGNTATSLGPIDSCVSVSTGDTFEVDLFIADVADLAGWEASLEYDMTVINVVSRDVMMFQAAEPESRVFDLSEALPDLDGRYRMTVLDTAAPSATESGLGVLARLTLKAMAAGVSPANLLLLDIDGDGKMDGGPFLTSSEGEAIGDIDGNGVFDGPISNAQIAVDTACPSGTPVPPGTTPTAVPTLTATPPAATATPTAPAVSPTPGVPPAMEGDESEGTNGPPWMIVYAAGGVAGLAILVAGGVALARLRRGRAR